MRLLHNALLCKPSASHLSVLQISLSACSIVLSSALNSNSLAKFTCGEKIMIHAPWGNKKSRSMLLEVDSHLLDVGLAGHVVGADKLNELLV